MVILAAGLIIYTYLSLSATHEALIVKGEENAMHIGRGTREITDAVSFQLARGEGLPETDQTWGLEEFYLRVPDAPPCSLAEGGAAAEVSIFYRADVSGDTIVTVSVTVDRRTSLLRPALSRYASGIQRIRGVTGAVVIENGGVASGIEVTLNTRNFSKIIF